MRIDFPDWKGADLITFRNSQADKFSSNSQEMIISPLFYLTETNGNPVISQRHSGALIEKTTDQLIVADTFAPISWDSDGQVYDTDGYWDSSAPTRFTIPEGIHFVKLSSNVSWNSFAGLSTYTVHRILKNGNASDNSGTGANRQSTNDPQTGCQSNCTTTTIQVSPGDYFEVWVNQGANDDGGTGHDINSFQNRTWFCIQAVG
jgi:hypothetical protein